MTRSFVRYTRPTQKESEQNVEYNLDIEDEEWVTNHYLFGKNIGTNNIQQKVKDEEGCGNGEKPITVLQEDLKQEKTEIVEGDMSLTGNNTSSHHHHNEIRFSAIKKVPTLPLNVFEQMLDLLEKATALETIITLAQAERLILSKIPSILQIFGYTNATGPTKNSNGNEGNASKQQNEKNNQTVSVRTVIQEVYNYWVDKRSKLKKPLLRKYWPVTASNDTNPHMVFRPREKEKYKLRKKRQNDLDAFKKMKQLRLDFLKVRVLLDLVERREKLNKCIFDMQSDWFEQRLYGMVDTSGLLRESDRLSFDEVEEALNVPKYFDTQHIDRGKKRKRKKSNIVSSKGRSRLGPSPVPISGNTDLSQSGNFTKHANANQVQTNNLPKQICADQNNPPMLLHPLKTRDSYATSWENAVPFIPSYVNSQPTPTMRFRHRPRIGRGGRVIIDRIPRPCNPNVPSINVFTSGTGAQMTNHENNRMLDLLPEPLNTKRVSRRIEEIAAAALGDDDDQTGSKSINRAPSLPTAAAAAGTSTQIDESNNTEYVVVKMCDWIETDEQMWGPEISTLGSV